MPERIQSNMSDQWSATLSSKRGWNNYVPNHWTKYATGNKIDLSSQEIKKGNRQELNLLYCTVRQLRIFLNLKKGM